MREQFGEAYAESVAKDYVLSNLGGRTVNKALADFAARGWIQLAAKSVLVIDPDRLRKRAR